MCPNVLKARLLLAFTHFTDPRQVQEPRMCTLQQRQTWNSPVSRSKNPYCHQNDGFIQKRRQRSSLLFEGQNLNQGDMKKIINSTRMMIWRKNELHQDDMKKRMNFTRVIWRKGRISPGRYEEYDEFIPFFKSSCCKIASTAMNWISLPNISDDRCLLFCFILLCYRPSKSQHSSKRWLISSF